MKSRQILNYLVSPRSGYRFPSLFSTADAVMGSFSRMGAGASMENEVDVGHHENDKRDRRVVAVIVSELIYFNYHEAIMSATFNSPSRNKLFTFHCCCRLTHRINVIVSTGITKERRKPSLQTKEYKPRTSRQGRCTFTIM